MEKVEEPKKLHFRTILILFIVTIASLGIWSRYISTNGLTVKEYAIINEKIPENFHGFKIIHFSDLHFGRTINNERLKEIVKTINQYKPDLVVFTGDLVDKDITLENKEVKTLGNILKEIDPLITKIAVKGNHDYDKDYFNIAMELAEFKVLNNEIELIYYKGETPIIINGIPSFIKEDYEVINEQTENEELLYKIVLAHEPDALDKYPELNSDLMFSGHSHGGQIRLPFFGAVYTPYGAKKYYEEHYIVNNTELFVSSGIGTSQMNFRFLNKPSINLYRLYSH